ncbi:MAG TPA: isopentenyl-diphosphate Delta-isomerase [Bacteroidetes bacterium]|nr:isopentenyl-diphosphate Delta-isomerase [Bacteroidota bacterium]
MHVEYVILVNNHDQSLGAMEKMEAHEKGVMHRAFSIFIFNSEGKLLLQQRADEKYHSPGLWTNTVCSHPRTGENTHNAAHRRMVEEMGFDCDLEEAFSFIYKANVGDGLTEHEFDHVFVGYSDKKPDPNPDEVSGWKYVDFDWVVDDVANNPQNYTVWFVIALEQVKAHLKKVRS